MEAFKSHTHMRQQAADWCDDLVRRELATLIEYGRAQRQALAESGELPPLPASALTDDHCFRSGVSILLTRLFDYICDRPLLREHVLGALVHRYQCAVTSDEAKEQAAEKAEHVSSQMATVDAMLDKLMEKVAAKEES